MPKIKKIIEEGSIQYPATITDAVKNPNNRKTVTQELSELGSKVVDIESEIIKTNEESIIIEDNYGNTVAEINSKSSNFNNLMNNGKSVLTDHQDLSWIGSKEEVFNLDEILKFVSDDYDGKDNGEEYASVDKNGLTAKAFRYLDGTSLSKKVDCYGASHVDFGTWINSLQQLLGSSYIVRNYGIGGQGPDKITYRQGSVPFYVKESVIIPPAKNERVEIELNRWPGDTGNLININVTNEHSNVNPVSICGIEGKLTYEDSSYYFERIKDGSSFELPKYSFVRTRGYKDKGDITILWLGSNVNLEDEDSYNYTLSLIKKATECVVNGKYLVIGNHAVRQDSGYNFTIETVKKFNSDLKDEYGNKFVDQLEYMSKYGLELLGLTPTADDLQDKGEGKIPRQLLDSIQLHYTEAASYLLGELFYGAIVENGYLGNNW